jgi:hypothetical protein
LTISIAVSTDIGDLQRRAVVDAVAKEAHHVAALVQCIDHPRLLRRRDLGEDAGLLDGNAERLVGHHLDLAT